MATDSLTLDSVDRRRPPTSIEVDGASFLSDGLVDLAHKRWNQVVPALDWLALSPMDVVIGEERFVLAIENGRLFVANDPTVQSDATIVEFTLEQLRDIVADQVTPMGLFSSGKLLRLDGKLELLLDWWLVLRAIVDDIPIHVPGSMDFTALDGSQLDLTTVFRLNDDPEVMNRFLTQCGYLHIAGAFPQELMDRISADMDIYAPVYSQGDGKSWWATLDDGTDRVVRMQGFHSHSAATDEALHSEVLTTVASLMPDGHEVAGGTNPIEALFKPIGVQKGISDVPWHKDCALGRHRYDCCAATVGISVSGAAARSGQLRAVAGSHRALLWSSMLRDGTDLPVVDLPTEAGDITVHLSCTLHMAQPPVDAERRVLYTTLTLPDQGPTDRSHISEIREAASVTISQPPAEQERSTSDEPGHP